MNVPASPSEPNLGPQGATFLATEHWSLLSGHLAHIANGD
jgi:hypothetical protein